MTTQTSLEMIKQATIGKYTVGAFNITSFVQMKALIDIHARLEAPVIIQASVSPSKFYSPEVVAAVYKAMAGPAKIPASLHLDHCTDVEFCMHCADAGYTSIMFDGSKLPFEENIQQTKKVADYCHKKGITVEGELGTVSGVEDQIRVASDEAALCNPDQVLEFVEKTGIDLLAPAIGTAHGIYKTADPKIDFDRFEKIFNILNGKQLVTPLVVHGGTGLPEATVRRLIQLGGAKFNVSTDLKHKLIDTTHQYISEHADEYDPGKVDKAVVEGTMKLVEGWVNMFGGAGKIG